MCIVVSCTSSGVSGRKMHTYWALLFDACSLGFACVALSCHLRFSFLIYGFLTGICCASFIDAVGVLGFSMC